MLSLFQDKSTHQLAIDFAANFDAERIEHDLSAARYRTQTTAARINTAFFLNETFIMLPCHGAAFKKVASVQFACSCLR